MPSVTGSLPASLNRARYGITANPTTQTALDRTSSGLKKDRNESVQYGKESQRNVREWGSKAHDMFMQSTQRRQQLAAAAESQRQMQQASNLGGQQWGQSMPQLGQGYLQGQARGMRPGQTGLPDSGINYGPTAFRQGIIDRAKSYLGTPYSLGGGHGGGGHVGPSHGIHGWGIDCSGLTGIVYKQMGIQLPGLADAQTAYGRRTNISNARPGDLVGWTRGGHVGIYIGNGQILHAPSPGKTVEIRNIFRGEAIYAVQLSLPGDR